MSNRREQPITSAPYSFLIKLIGRKWVFNQKLIRDEKVQGEAMHESMWCSHLETHAHWTDELLSEYRPSLDWEFILYFSVTLSCNRNTLYMIKSGAWMIATL